MDSYVNDMHNTFKPLYATWPPGVPLGLGDFGELLKSATFIKRNKFVRRGNITTAFGIEFKTRDDKTQDHYACRSAGSVEVDFSPKGKGRNVKAELKIGFSSSDAIFFDAACCVHDSIENLLEVVDGIKKAYHEGRWNESHVFVCQIVKAGASTVIISKSKGASISLEAKSDAVPKIDLADASISLSVNRSKSIGLEIVTQQGMTPLVGLARFLPKKPAPSDSEIVRMMSNDALFEEASKYASEKEEEFTGKTFYL